MISRISIPLALLTVLLVSSLPFASPAAPADYDLIIRNGRVIDGTGRPGFNLGTFVGATQVREYVIGYDDRPPTPAELAQMKKLVADAMKDGALGVSTSLQYVPARFARTDEIVELAKVAHQYGGIYITHQRSEANAIDDSMKEVFEIARRAHIPAEIWHFKTAYQKNWGRMP